MESNDANARIRLPMDRVRFAQLGGDSSHLLLGLLEANALSEPREDGQQSPVSRTRERVLERRPQIRVLERERFFGKQQLERGRHHPHDVMRGPVHLYRLPHNRGIAAEPSLPETMTENDDLWAMHHILVGEEPSSQQRLHSQ